MNHLINNSPTAWCPGRLEDGGGCRDGSVCVCVGGAVTFTVAYHVVV